LEFLNEEGAQAEVWALSRILLDTLAKETGQVWIQGYLEINKTFALSDPSAVASS
jgi:hypothetical protein